MLFQSATSPSLSVVKDEISVATTLNEPTRKRKRKRKPQQWEVTTTTMYYRDNPDYDVVRYFQDEFTEVTISDTDPRFPFLWSGVTFGPHDDPVLHINGSPISDVLKRQIESGKVVLHAFPLVNWDSFPNEDMFKAHSFGDLSDGISKNGLKPLSGIERGPRSRPHIWFVPGGRISFAVSHLKKYRADMLLASGNKIGLIVIPAGDERIKQLRRFRAGGPYPRQIHPVRTAQPMNAYEYDTLVLDADHIPYIFRNCPVHPDIVPLRTDAEKKATRDAYFKSNRGRATRAASVAAYSKSELGKATKAAYKKSDHGKATRAVYAAKKVATRAVEKAAKDEEKAAIAAKKVATKDEEKVKRARWQ